MLRPFKMNPLLGLGLGASFILVCVFFPFSGGSYTSNREPHFEKTGRRCCLQILQKLSSIFIPCFFSSCFFVSKGFAISPSPQEVSPSGPATARRRGHQRRQLLRHCGGDLSVPRLGHWAAGHAADPAGGALVAPGTEQWENPLMVFP